jgi:hypothetical protein
MIRTSDLRFMRRGPLPIELPLGSLKTKSLERWTFFFFFELDHYSFIKISQTKLGSKD